jgi:hypothetical protein
MVVDFVVGTAIVGFLVWLLIRFIPMPHAVRVALVVVVAVWVVLRGLALLGVRLP